MKLLDEKKLFSFREKAPLLMFDWVLNRAYFRNLRLVPTSAIILIALENSPVGILELQHCLISSFCFSTLIPLVPTPQNSQTYSNNSSAAADELFPRGCDTWVWRDADDLFWSFFIFSYIVCRRFEPLFRQWHPLKWLSLFYIFFLKPHFWHFLDNIIAPMKYGINI